MTPDDLAREIKVSAIAHAIRLGKCPRPGMVMGCNMALDHLDTETGQVQAGAKQAIEFEVTERLIEEARDAINTQRAQYREPKTTVVTLNGDQVPEDVWKRHAPKERM